MPCSAPFFLEFLQVATVQGASLSKGDEHADAIALAAKPRSSRKECCGHGEAGASLPSLINYSSH